MEAGGADARPGDRVALLGGAGTLADLSTALPEGPGQAGCQERGHQGGSGLLSRTYPIPLCQALLFPFYFKPRFRKPFMAVKFSATQKAKGATHKWFLDSRKDWD